MARPLRSILEIAGTVEYNEQDVFFCAGKCVVVPAGTVDGLLKSAVRRILQ